jgi:hypothetical protein
MLCWFGSINTTPENLGFVESHHFTWVLEYLTYLSLVIAQTCWSSFTGSGAIPKGYTMSMFDSYLSIEKLYTDLRVPHVSLPFLVLFSFCLGRHIANLMCRSPSSLSKITLSICSYMRLYIRVGNSSWFNKARRLLSLCRLTILPQLHCCGWSG